MVGSIGRLGSYGDGDGAAGGGAGGIVTSVVGGLASVVGAGLNYAATTKNLKGQLLLADAQGKNDAATAKQNFKTAQLQLQAQQAAAAAQIQAAQMQAAQLAAGGSAKTAVTVVAAVTGLMLAGVGSFLLYKWAVK